MVPSVKWPKRGETNGWNDFAATTDSSSKHRESVCRDSVDSLVHMVLHAVGAVGRGWKRLGYLVAGDGPALHILDAGAHDDLFVRGAGRDCVRVFDTFHHVPERLAAARCFHFDVGLPRTAGRVHLRVGRGRDDRRGTV